VTRPVVPQLAAALALVDLLREHPEQAGAAMWSIDRRGYSLHGFVPERSAAGGHAVEVLARLLGDRAELEPSEYLSGGMLCRTVRVDVVWRDVRVEVCASVPVTGQAA
jgi:hypothetical protein